MTDFTDLHQYIIACRSRIDEADAAAKRAEIERQQRYTEENRQAWEKFVADVRTGLPPLLLPTFEQLYQNRTGVPAEAPVWYEYITLPLPDCARIRLRFDLDNKQNRYVLRNVVEYETFEIAHNYYGAEDDPQVKFDRWLEASSLDEAIGQAARWHLRRAEMQAEVERLTAQTRAPAAVEEAKLQREYEEMKQPLDDERMNLIAFLDQDLVLRAAIKLIAAIQDERAGVRETIESMNDSLYARSKTDDLKAEISKFKKWESDRDW